MDETLQKCQNLTASPSGLFRSLCPDIFSIGTSLQIRGAERAYVVLCLGMWLPDSEFEGDVQNIIRISKQRVLNAGPDSSINLVLRTMQLSKLFRWWSLSKCICNSSSWLFLENQSQVWQQKMSRFWAFSSLHTSPLVPNLLEMLLMFFKFVSWIWHWLDDSDVAECFCLVYVQC